MKMLSDDVIVEYEESGSNDGHSLPPGVVPLGLDPEPTVEELADSAADGQWGQFGECLSN